MTKKTAALAGLVFLLICVLPLRALAAEELLVNADFMTDGVPDGWTVFSYLEEHHTVVVGDGMVVLYSTDFNDVRLYQEVAVESGATYILTGEIMTEGVVGGYGASLTVDNLPVDGSYLYSTGILGTSEWQPARLAFITAPGQTMVRVGVRVGGYSNVSMGLARFRNVSLVRAEGSVPDAMALVTYDVSQSENDDNSFEAEYHRIILRSNLHLFMVLSVTLAVILLFGVYRGRERLGDFEIERKRERLIFWLAVLAGLVLRFVLASIWKGHDSDMLCWSGWGNEILQNGTAAFYTAPGHEWYDYPPGYMLVLSGIAALIKLFGIPDGSSLAVFAYMLPAFAADVGIGLLLMRTARERGFQNSWPLLLGLVAIFNPASVFLSGAWGQIDAVLCFFLALAFLLLLRDRRILAGAVYGLAVMIKWQALIFGPVLAAAYLLRVRSGKNARDTVLAVLAAFLVIFAITLPFKGGQGLFWFVSRFLNATGGYDFASVEAYNFHALVGGNWRPAASPIFLGISHKTFGVIAIVLAVLLSIAMQIRAVGLERTKKPIFREGGVLFVAAAFCMYMIYTLGHYMHERYFFPVMILLLFAFVFTRKPFFLFSALLASVILFLNEATAMYVVSELASATVRSGREHQAVVRACSLAETVSFLFFTGFLIQCFFPSEGKGGKRHV